MKRKLIKQGIGGLTFYVPKKWTENNNLKAGDEIDVKEEGTNLLLSKDFSLAYEKKIEISINNSNKRLLRILLSAAYRRGYTEVTINSEKPGLLAFSEINKVVDSLIGFEVTEETESKAVIKAIMNDNFEETKNIISKYMGMVKYVTSEIVNNGNKSDIEELLGRIYKYRDYCQRAINITKYEGDKSYEYSTIIYLCEKIASNFFRAYPVVKNNAKDIKYAKELLDMLLESFNKKDLKEALKCNDLIKEHDPYLKKDILPIFGAMRNNLLGLSSRIISVII